MALLGTAPDADAAAMVDEVNRARAVEGLAPLRIEPRLSLAASEHACDMAERRFFSHEGSDGSRVDARVRKAGYAYRLVAENIAAGQPSPVEVVDGWMHSDGHRRNILRPSATEAGVGYALADDASGFRHYWVLVLGQPEGW